MKMSEQKKQKVYDAISNSITDLRVKVAKKHGYDRALEIDGDLFRLELEIWKRVKSALGVDGA